MDDKNYSSFEIPHPSRIVQPEVYYLVVTRGPQVGIFGAFECREIDLEKLLSGREYALSDFEDWRSAFAYYKKCFDLKDIAILGDGNVAACEGRHINSSGRHIPHPESLVEPEGNYLVVTRGHKVGIFDQPGQIDLQRLFSTPGYALRHFSYWKPAYRFYKASFEDKEVALTARLRKRRRPASSDFSNPVDYVSDCDIIPVRSRGDGERAAPQGESSGAQTRVIRTSKRVEYDIAAFGASAPHPPPKLIGPLKRSASEDAMPEDEASSSE